MSEWCRTRSGRPAGPSLRPGPAGRLDLVFVPGSWPDLVVDPARRPAGPSLCAGPADQPDPVLAFESVVGGCSS